MNDQLPVAQQDRFLVIGLGNPGKKYAHNRHNIGFMAVDRLALAHDIALNRVQEKSIVGKGQIKGFQVMIAKPQTYMNRSGISVRKLTNFYKIEHDRIIVIYDELDLPFGAIRLRKKGGAGGHNGMKSIIQQLGQEISRLRIGIGRPPGKMDPAAFVLKDFQKEESLVLNEVLDDARVAIESFILDGIDLAMTRHNK